MPTILVSTPVTVYQLQLLQSTLSKAAKVPSAPANFPPSSSMDSQVWL